MATKADLFSSRFFKAENLKRPTVLEISECNVEKLKNAEGVAKEKLVIYFVGQKQQLVCNLTNFDSIAEIVGEDDSDTWVGAKICLFPTTTQLGNKKVACIRVKAPPAAAPTPKAKAPTPKANGEGDFNIGDEPPPHTEAPPFDDDISEL